MKKPEKSYERVKYEVDPYNRLTAAETNTKGRQANKTQLSGFRHTLIGRFKIDKNNSLSYIVRAPALQGARVPHQIRLKGKWALADDHNLNLTLDKKGRQTLGDKLTLQGQITDATKNSLLFTISTRTKENTKSTYTLSLQGRWQADKRNRLTFRVKKQQGKHDILTFKGAWRINDHHQIIYKYKKAQLIKKQKKIHTLIFKGYWDIKDNARLYYIIDKKSGSVFSFKTDVGIFKSNYIKYKVGIGVFGKEEPLTRVVTLYGTWKVKRGIGLIFETEYENKRMHAIAFGAKAKLTARDKISFKLKNTRNKEIEGEVKLSHKILKGDGEAFLRFLKSNRESAVFLGTGFRW